MIFAITDPPCSKLTDWRISKPSWSQRESFCGRLVEMVVQQVLEAEMSEALRAGKGERTAGRLGYYVRS